MKATKKEQAEAAVECIMQTSPYSKEYTAKAILASVVGIAKSQGASNEEIAAQMMPAVMQAVTEETAPAARTGLETPKRYSMIRSNAAKEDIEAAIDLLNTFLLFSELILAGEMERYAARAIKYMEEHKMLRHQMKKHANTVKETIATLTRRCNWEDREVVLRQCLLVTWNYDYGKRFYEDGGSFLNRLQTMFNKDYALRIKCIRMDNKWMAEGMGVKHTELAADLFTIMSLAQTDIEIYNEVQSRKRAAARGRGTFRTIKSTHCEALINAVQSILDQFIPRGVEAPKEQVSLLRTHFRDFQMDITSPKQFELFDSQIIALGMDFIEYMLACMRMEMERGKNVLPYRLMKMVRIRMGSRKNARQAMKELASIPSPLEDMDALDYSKVIAVAKGDFKALNSFRRLCLDNRCLPPEKETEQDMQYRVLRVVARKFKGELPDDVLASLVRAHGTKKAVVEQLQKAGFELKPTLDRVKKMKASELKQIA